MADVFISYASEDRETAAKLATALGAQGWSVWWDRKIVAGQVFDHAIERELETAKSVVVLWSGHSVASEWVKNEATVAAERGVLVPAVIEGVKLPLEFRRKQAADLTNWEGDRSHNGFQSLCEGIVAAIGRPLQHQSAPFERQPARLHRRWVLAAIAVIAVAMGLGVYSSDVWRAGIQTPASSSARSEPGAPESKEPTNAVGGLADLVVGDYFGDVIADAKGSSRSNVALTVSKLDRARVRVTSDYQRLGTVDVELTRIGNQIFNVGGDATLIVDLDRNPPTLAFDPSEVAYRGNRQ